MIKSNKHIILIDDNSLSNMLAKMIIKKALGDVEIKDFELPKKALEYIQKEFENSTSDDHVTLFLDLNMPELTGWEFIEIFKGFKEQIKKQFKIYILSSSIDQSDIIRAKENPLVEDFIEKPINQELIKKMFS